jgi:hypothetical protein
MTYRLPPHRSARGSLRRDRLSTTPTIAARAKGALVNLVKHLINVLVFRRNFHLLLRYVLIGELLFNLLIITFVPCRFIATVRSPSSSKPKTVADRRSANTSSVLSVRFQCTRPSLLAKHPLYNHARVSAFQSLTHHFARPSFFALAFHTPFLSRSRQTRRSTGSRTSTARVHAAITHACVPSNHSRATHTRTL